MDQWVGKMIPVTVETYLEAKTLHEQQTAIIAESVSEVFAEYSRQKRVVSTKPYARWGNYHIHRFHLTATKLNLNLAYYGTYGYSEDANLTLPADLVRIDLRDEEGALHAAVAEIIAAEGADIARREAIIIAKQKEEQAAREKAELDAALELVRKWEAEKGEST